MGSGKCADKSVAVRLGGGACSDDVCEVGRAVVAKDEGHMLPVAELLLFD